MSALSRMIEESEVPDEETADQRENGGLALTIYLPDCNSLTVHVKETCNFRDVIQRTLLTHEKLGLQPPLLYNDIGAYELRIHEGKSYLLSCLIFRFIVKISASLLVQCFSINLQFHFLSKCSNF